MDGGGGLAGGTRDPPSCEGVRRGDLGTGEVVGLAGGRPGFDPLPAMGLEAAMGLGGALVTSPLPSASSWPFRLAKTAASSVLTVVDASVVLLTLVRGGLGGWFTEGCRGVAPVPVVVEGFVGGVGFGLVDAAGLLVCVVLPAAVLGLVSGRGRLTTWAGAAAVCLGLGL